MSATTRRSFSRGRTRTTSKPTMFESLRTARRTLNVVSPWGAHCVRVLHAARSAMFQHLQNPSPRSRSCSCGPRRLDVASSRGNEEAKNSIGGDSVVGAAFDVRAATLRRELVRACRAIRPRRGWPQNPTFAAPRDSRGHQSLSSSHRRVVLPSTMSALLCRVRDSARRARSVCLNGAGEIVRTRWSEASRLRDRGVLS